MTEPMKDGAVHLLPLPEQLRRLDPPVREDVLALVSAEHAAWRGLHDRLIGLIAALLDIACEDQSLEDVIDQVIEAAAVPLDQLVGRAVEARDVATLLRAHGSVGTVAVEGEGADRTVEFRHACGSGQRYWRDNPDATTVAEGEVAGVPAGRPRYCARCVRSIEAHAAGSWTVSPPPDAVQPCVWRVTAPEESA